MLGNLDRRITIQGNTPTASDSGGDVDNWADVATVYAEKVENRGDERFATQQLVGHAVVTFRIRWSDTVKVVTDKHRIVFDGRTYNITAVREIGRREGIEMDAFAAAEQPVAP